MHILGSSVSSREPRTRVDVLDVSKTYLFLFKDLLRFIVFP